MSEVDPLSPQVTNHSTNAPTEGDPLTGYESIDESNPRPEEAEAPEDDGTAVYITRWYILLVMSLSAAIQNACWGIWGPIAQSAKAVFGWDTALLTVMINCGNAGVLTGLVPAGYVVNKYGLRVSVLLTLLFLTLSPALKIITNKPFVSSIFIGFGQYFAGTAGSFTQVCFAKVSETWFPSSERSRATTIAVLFNAVGGAAAFLLGPGIVNQPAYNETHNSTDNNHTDEAINKVSMEKEIRVLNLLELGFSGALLLMALIYFPKKPPKPPSISATVPRQAFREGFRKLIGNVNIWRVNVVCSIAYAVFVNWLGLLDENLHDMGVSQKQAGWYGFYACVAGTVGGIFIGWLADRFPRSLKLFQMLLLSVGTLDAVGITLMRNGYIAHTNGAFAAGVALLGMLVYTTFPLNIEYGCEIGYPVAAEIVGMGIAITLNAAAVAFLLVQLIPGIGINWMNWTLVGLLALPVLFMCTFREQYHRMDVDTLTKKQ